MSHTTISLPDYCDSHLTRLPASPLLLYSLFSTQQPEWAFKTASHIMSLFSKPSDDFWSVFTTKFQVLTLVYKAWHGQLQAASLTHLLWLPPYFTSVSLAFLHFVKQIKKFPPLRCAHTVPSARDILSLDGFEVYISLQSGLFQLSLYQRGFPWFPVKIASRPPLHLYLLTMLWFSSSYLSSPDLRFSVYCLSLPTKL